MESFCSEETGFEKETNKSFVLNCYHFVDLSKDSIMTSQSEEELDRQFCNFLKGY
jgi:hypothetical protein